MPATRAVKPRFVQLTQWFDKDTRWPVEILAQHIYLLRPMAAEPDYGAPERTLIMTQSGFGLVVTEPIDAVKAVVEMVL